MKNIGLITYILAILLSLGFSINQITKYRLLHDENYVLARANGNTINPLSRAYPFDLKSDLIPASEFVKLSNKNYQEINPITDAINYAKSFTHYSNHPPLNAILAKAFIIKESSIINIRWYGFTCFLFLIFTIYILQSTLGFNTVFKLRSIALFTCMSLVNFSSFFPKGYSLAGAFLILSINFIIKSQKETQKNWFLILSFLFSHLAMLTHYFTGILSMASVIAYLLFKDRTKNLLASIILFSSFLIYIPLYKEQIAGTNGYFNKHLGFYEIIQSIKNFIQVLSFNYHEPYSIFVFCFVFGLIIFSYKEITKNIDIRYQILFFLIPYLIFPVLDWVFNKHVIDVIRYQLPAFPFFAILLSFILDKKNYLISLLIFVLLFVNLFNPKLQKHTSILNSATDYMEVGMKFDLKKLDEKTLFITKNMFGEELTFMQHLFNKIIRQHPLKAIKLEELEKNPQFNNIYFASRQIRPEILEEKLIQEDIKQVYVIGEDTKIKLPKEIKKKYWIKI